MSAYINKCSSCSVEGGIMNCDLHKSMNKSTISLSNISCYHGKESYSAIGSGRPSYKNYQSA